MHISMVEKIDHISKSNNNHLDNNNTKLNNINSNNHINNSNNLNNQLEHPISNTSDRSSINNINQNNHHKVGVKGHSESSVKEQHINNNNNNNNNNNSNNNNMSSINNSKGQYVAVNNNNNSNTTANNNNTANTNTSTTPAKKQGKLTINQRAPKVNMRGDHDITYNNNNNSGNNNQNNNGKQQQQHNINNNINNTNHNNNSNNNSNNNNNIGRGYNIEGDNHNNSNGYDNDHNSITIDINEQGYGGGGSYPMYGYPYHHPYYFHSQIQPYYMYPSYQYSPMATHPHQHPPHYQSEDQHIPYNHNQNNNNSNNNYNNSKRHQNNHNNQQNSKREIDENRQQQQDNNTKEIIKNETEKVTITTNGTQQQQQQQQQQPEDNQVEDKKEEEVKEEEKDNTLVTDTLSSRKAVKSNTTTDSLSPEPNQLNILNINFGTFTSKYWSETSISSSLRLPNDFATTSNYCRNQPMSKSSKATTISKQTSTSSTSSSSTSTTTEETKSENVDSTTPTTSIPVDTNANGKKKKKKNKNKNSTTTPSTTTPVETSVPTTPVKTSTTPSIQLPPQTDILSPSPTTTIETTTTTTTTTAPATPIAVSSPSVQVNQSPINLADLIKQTMAQTLNSTKQQQGSSTDSSISNLNGNQIANPKKLYKDIEKKLVWLRGQEEKSKPIAYHSKGLVNTSNTCFMNVILQSLVGCQPFLKLLKNIAEFDDLPHSKYPTLHMLQLFYNDYFSNNLQNTTNSSPSTHHHTPTKHNNNNNNNNNSLPSNPKYFNEIVKSFNGKVSPPSNNITSPSAAIPLSIPLSNKKRNKLNLRYENSNTYQQMSSQQDAQEFFNYFLDLIHEEFVTLIKEIEGPKEEKVQTNEDGWELVGAKNKTSIINDHTTNNQSSPISQLFSGTLRSSVNSHESKESVTLQPFYCLHLDIRPESITTLDDALSLFMKEETLEGYTSTKGVEVTASKSMSIEILPRILIVHFKRFAYDTEAQKLDKHISFPLQLSLKAHQLGLKKYSLFSVVSHHGRGLSQGHYTCDILQLNGQWSKFDDANITEVNESDILKREAYLLLYQQQ